ncbi:NUDIX domain-containing protein [Streptomyces rimosus]|uniref:NUDIX hydrolase n=1 Tax=Streptomyces rimosus TaxID=1927 RepID=UPI0004C7CCC3|nr:NUDIX domain-containing protein [Streptomyces rimosus]
MSTATPIVDTHVILRDGDKILLSRRGSSYGYGRWHLPSGKLDTGEPLTAGAARELFEETGITAHPDSLRQVHVVHHRQAPGAERLGFFFLATRWEGEPTNREPDKCLDLRFFDVQDLPEDIIEYPAAGLYGYLTNAGPLTLHGWAPAWPPPNTD